MSSHAGPEVSNRRAGSCNTESMRADVRVRDFVATDQRAAATLIQAGLRDRWGDAFDPAMNPDLDDLWASYMTNGSQLLVGVDGGDTVIGTGALIADPNGARIVRMSVGASARRQGVARTLVAALVDRARAAGVTHVVVSTDIPWTDAIALYESCGFTITGRSDDEVHLRLRVD